MNPFLAKVSTLYPLKIPENQKFFGIFRRYKMGTLTENGLNELNIFIVKIKGAKAILINYFPET